MIYNTVYSDENHETYETETEMKSIHDQGRSAQLCIVISDLPFDGLNMHEPLTIFGPIAQIRIDNVKAFLGM